MSILVSLTIVSELLGGGAHALIVKLLACGLQQAEQHILVLAAFELLRLELRPHLRYHVFKHVDNLLFGVGARFSFSLDALSDAVLFFGDPGLHLQVTLLSLHHFQLDLVVELGEVVLQARLEVLKSVISCLGLLGQLGPQLSEPIIHEIREALLHLKVSLALIREILRNPRLKRGQLTCEGALFVLSLLPVGLDVGDGCSESLLQEHESFLVRVMPISYFIVNEGQLLVNLSKLLVAISFNIELHILQPVLNAPDPLIVLSAYSNGSKSG